VISDDNNIFESDEKLDLKSRGKWNDDTDCPATFDNMDFIYTSANKGNIDEICSSDVDEIDIVTIGLPNVSCTSSETNKGPALESQKSVNFVFSVFSLIFSHCSFSCESNCSNFTEDSLSFDRLSERLSINVRFGTTKFGV
jgi:hypothetical protein